MSNNYKKCQLIKSAAESSTNNGHRLSRWKHSVEFWGDKYSVAHCLDCGANVQVNQRPAPNEVDIGGAVFGIHCPKVMMPSLMTLSVCRKLGFDHKTSYAWEAEGR